MALTLADVHRIAHLARIDIDAGEAADVHRKLGLEKPMLPIRSVRRLGKKDMLHNAALPNIEVDPQTFKVYADGKLLHVEPATSVPLNRRYMLR